MRALAPSEEGARFPISMVSSGVWAGKIPLDKAHSLQEVGDGKKTMKQELERIGYLGATESNFNKIPIAVSSTICDSFHNLRADYNEWQAHFELHIGEGQFYNFLVHHQQITSTILRKLVLLSFYISVFNLSKSGRLIQVIQNKVLVWKVRDRK